MDAYSAVCGLILLLLVARRLLWLCLGPRCDFATHQQTVPADAFAGKVCWITGASAGIGAGLAHELAAHGASVVLSARRAEALRDVARSLPCPAKRVCILPVDLEKASVEELQAVAAEAIAAFGGRLDYLFNNAGVSTRAFARDLDPTNLEAIIRLNFVAPAVLTKSCLPALSESHGVVANTSSIAAIIALPLRAAYCASKAALATWHEAMRYEEIGRVSVVNIYPGSVRTDIARNSLVGAARQRRQASDLNIESGLSVAYCAKRMVAAAYGRLQSSWIAKPKELLAAYAFFYIPALWPVLAPKFASKYVAKIMESQSIYK
jgi:dehydrogenase/reductase SDR family member 7B